MAGSRPPKVRPEITVPKQEKLRTAFFTDKELPQTLVGIVHKVPHRPNSSPDDYRRMLAERLYHHMLNARLLERTEVPDAPFLFAQSTQASLIRPIDTLIQVALVKGNDVARSLRALGEETERIRRHGFTPGEMSRARTAMLNDIDTATTDHLSSSDLAEELGRHHLEDEAVPGLEAERAFQHLVLPTITLDDINQQTETWLAPQNRVVMVSGPEGIPMPTPADINRLWTEIKSADLAPYTDRTSDAPLMSNIPTPVPFEKEVRRPGLGVVEWHYPNGAVVVARQVFTDDREIRMAALGPGGLAQIDDASFVAGSVAAELVSKSGVGDLDGTQLRKRFMGSNLQVGAAINPRHQGFSGRAAPEELETLMQLVFLLATKPRMEKPMFQAWQNATLELLTSRSADPQTVFRERFESKLYRNHPRKRVPTSAQIRSLTADKVMRVFQERFQAPGDMVFVFTGVIDLDKLQQLASTYLANLPPSARRHPAPRLFVFAPL